MDAFWLLRYLPAGRRRMDKFRATSEAFNKFTAEKVAEVRSKMKEGEEPTNFIAAYLKEVEKSKGKLEDR